MVRKQMIAIWIEIGTFEITEQRLVIRQESLGQMAPRDGEENLEINDILAIEGRIRNEPNVTEIRVHGEIEITD